MCLARSTGRAFRPARAASRLGSSRTLASPTMTRNFCSNIASNNRRRTTAQRLIAVAAIAVVGTAFMPVRSAAEDDLLQKAINYVFTGTVDPRTPPEIVDRQL